MVAVRRHLPLGPKLQGLERAALVSEVRLSFQVQSVALEGRVLAGHPPVADSVADPEVVVPRLQSYTGPVAAPGPVVAFGMIRGPSAEAGT